MNYQFSESFVKELIVFINTSQYGHVAKIAEMFQRELNENNKKAQDKAEKAKSSEKAKTKK